ncbi:B12-binding domain-containing radical SAM protein [Paucibacter sp. DJ1R-11]|uniref:B12-binding domain-containing radical SAM protein n=1 Tax=Paucibacter sp. DJ1R-11 TaxID=2893556 RepID=UPI0021E47F28|nr:radical SAM protein [Paucibacter sp. DJ1R-11]MCV2363464.1 B12-binding domain-containing radical SAM protein [Paucibacter sp. DJ1R-11]
MKRVLLINPRITSNARFPLAVMHLAAALRGRYATRILDGNLDPNVPEAAAAAVREGGYAAVGLSVMGGPQLPAALAVSRAIRAVAPELPIVWGGYFPTLCTDATLNSDCVDYALRGQGEQGFVELLDALTQGQPPGEVAGLSWCREGEIVHNADRAFSTAPLQLELSYDEVDEPQRYLGPTYLGHRTTGYQAALGCRYRCTFCGVAAMFRGKTALPEAERLERDLRRLQSRFGADSVQFYDHNFFDREVEMAPLLEVLARVQMPWWCYARADALQGLSAASWAQVRRSRLRMAYIGAESPSDSMLRDMRKGTRSDQTLAVVETCRANGVVPELSFMLAPPHDPEGETERTFDFIRQVKRLHPQAEIMLHIHTPLPPRRLGEGRWTPRDPALPKGFVFPDSADAWAQKEWVDYWCHKDAAWLSPALRERIRDFRTVLGCRFPTLTDIRAPAWQKTALRAASAWRYRTARYDRPRELRWLERAVKLWDPQLNAL